MRERIKRMVSKEKVPFIEVHLEEREGVEIYYVGKELESLNQFIDIGGNVRAFSNGIWFFASFNSFDELESHIHFVAREARLGSKGRRGRLAKIKPYVDEVTVKLDDDPIKVPINEKIKIAKSYNSRILRSKKIQSSKVMYEDLFQRRFYINSEGADIVEEKIYCGISFTALAKDGMNVQMIHKSKGDTSVFL